MSEAIIILAKASDIGPMGRGQAGKKKVYEIRVSGDTVTFSWGMAEKTQRQTQVIRTNSFQDARGIALEKKWDKMARGYRVVLEA
jgi:predicted DNA-binding WGR domain protein